LNNFLNKCILYNYYTDRQREFLWVSIDQNNYFFYAVDVELQTRYGQ